MLLLYTPRITKRKKYIFKLLVNNLIGYRFDLTDNREYYLSYKGAKINYSNQRLGKDELFFFSYGLLDEKGIKQYELKPDIFENVHTVFKSDNAESSLPYDPFSAAFYFVSRYEEYLPYTKDRFGRFEADQSFAYKNGFLNKPVVNHYATQIESVIKAKYPNLEVEKQRKFRFIPTYDIDIAYAYKCKGFFRTVGGYIKSLLELDFKSIKQRTKVLAGLETDPFDTYDFQLELSKKYGVKAYYFFPVADYGTLDKNPSINNTAYQKLIKTIGDYANMGIHTSYASNKIPGKIVEEKYRLSVVLNREIKYSRQHYLMLDLPHTYHRLMQADITHDFSMGFASHIGFRAGICSPFLFYDLNNESVTNIVIYPLAVMDGTLKDYMKLNVYKSREKVKKLIDEVYDVNGTFISLWHNESLCDCNNWKGWKELYSEIFEYAAGKEV